MISVGIIGATGYAGAELVRILLGHPQVKITAVSSVSFEGTAFHEVYPNYAGLFEQICGTQEEVITHSDVIFAALPHGLSEIIAEKAIAKGKLLIDLGADFRLVDEAEYKSWYGLDYKCPELHRKAVYSIPELHRALVPGKQIIANPGCYPTAIALGLAPALRAGYAAASSIICDCKSGTTGAGRGLSQTLHFPDCNEAFGAYKVASHRHTPEIEQTLSGEMGEAVRVTFVPHLLPVNRGILATCYLPLKTDVSENELLAVYDNAYKNEKFVRILSEGKTANIRQVRYSNFCDISLHLDRRTGILTVISAIDNMVKGAAGQAVQNMNILLGFDETAGLNLIPPAI